MALGIAGLAIVPRIWTNEWNSQNPDRVPSYWGFGPALWRGLIRVTPLCAGLTLLLGAQLVLLDLDLDATWVATAQEIGMYAMGVILLLIGAVVLLNEPKVLVPPHLRHQPGAMDEWRGANVRPTKPPRLRSGKTPSNWR